MTQIHSWYAKTIMNKNIKKREEGITLRFFCDKGIKGFHWHFPLKHLSSSIMEGKISMQNLSCEH